MESHPAEPAAPFVGSSCRREQTCPYLRRGRCLFSHPGDEAASVSLVGRDQPPEGSVLACLARLEQVVEQTLAILVPQITKDIATMSQYAEQDRQLLQEELWRQQKDFRGITKIPKFYIRYALARRKLIEDQNTILELSGRVQELQNEVNCMNDSKDFQDAESVRTGNSHVTSRPMSFPTHPIPEGMLRPSFVSPRRKEGPPCIWDTHGISGNVFANQNASSSALYPPELNPWRTTIEEPLHMSTAEKSERPERNRDLRCQSGPSAKDSVIFSGGDSSKNYGADQQRLQISDLHFDKLRQQPLLAGR